MCVAYVDGDANRMTNIDHKWGFISFAGFQYGNRYDFRPLVFMLILLPSLAPAARAQSDEAKKVLEQFGSWRPSDEKLIMYRLDWAPSVKAAMERAVRENRPVFIIAIHARYGDMFSGHC